MLLLITLRLVLTSFDLICRVIASLVVCLDVFFHFATTFFFRLMLFPTGVLFLVRSSINSVFFTFPRSTLVCVSCRFVVTYPSFESFVVPYYSASSASLRASSIVKLCPRAVCACNILFSDLSQPPTMMFHLLKSASIY
jgi:hypothetical protein